MIKKLLLALTVPLACQISAVAETVSLDVSLGDISISSTGYTQNELTGSGDFSYIITSSVPTPNSITIQGSEIENPILITLKDVTIDKNILTENVANAGAPIKVVSDYVTFSLEGTSVLKSINAFPGLALEGDANLYIQGDGTLKAYGSEKDGDQYTYRCSAGIGPDETANTTAPTGHLHILSGNVYAYSMGGGYGFGNGAANYYHGGVYGGSVALLGGSAHFFGGYHPHYNYITEGIGSRHQGVQVFFEGGELEAVLEQNTQPFVPSGQTLTKHSLENLSPYSLVKLPGMFNQQECGASTNSFGVLTYWTIDDQTLEDFIDGRALLQGTSNPNDHFSFKILGLGVYEKGTEAQLLAESSYSFFKFDHWGFGSTDNPTNYIVNDSEIIEAVFKLDAQQVWTMTPIVNREGECSAVSFNCPHTSFNYDIIEIPSTFEIDGKLYTVTELGSQEQNVSFYSRAFNSTLIIPSTIQKVSASFAEGLEMDMPFMEAGFGKIICNSLIPPALIRGEELIGVPENCELVVPDIAVDTYRNDSVWGKAFSNISVIKSDEFVYIDLSDGNVTISDNGYSVNDNFIESSGPYVLKSSETTSNEITITGGCESSPVSVVLYNIDIDRWTARGNGLNIPSGYIDMKLIGSNNIRGGHDGAGIWLPAEATLHVSGDGVLSAKAGSTNNGAWIAGAGIGGAVNSTSVGTLIIDSGSVYGYGILGSAGFGSGSVWTYTNTSSPNHGVLILNGGDAHFFGSSDQKYNTIPIPEGIGCAGNVPVVVFKNGGTLEASLRDGTPLVTDGRHYAQQIQPGLSPNQQFEFINHLGMAEHTVYADPNGNLTYWLADGQTRKDVTGCDYVIELYTDKDGYGYVSGAGFYNAGDLAEVSFTWQQGNHNFASWDNGSTANPYTFEVTEDIKLTAILSPSEIKAWRTGVVRDNSTGELSGSECYVESFNGDGFDIDILEVPSSFEINGTEYTTTQLGDDMEGMFHVSLPNQLAEFIMPATIKSVSPELGFMNCKVFTCLAPVPPSILKSMHFFDEDELSFYQVADDAILQVPFGAASLYRVAPGWKQFSTIVEIDPLEETWLVTAHSETECHIHAYGHPETFFSETLEVPETCMIEGKTYTVTAMGHPENGEININVKYNIDKFILPATINQVSPLLFGSSESESVHTLDDNSDSDTPKTSELLNVKFVVCKAAVPPVLTSMKEHNSFAQVPYQATLLVPIGSVQSYEAAPGWKEFSIIKSDAFNGIDDDILLEDNAATEVYNLHGIKVSSSLDNLPAGIYLVRKGNNVTKVSVR